VEFSWKEMVVVWVPLFAIIDPFGGIPVFLSLVQGEKNIARIALKSCLFAFLVLVIFLFAGRIILDFFRVSIPAFQVGGGSIIFLTGLPMLFAYPLGLKRAGAEIEEKEMEGDISLVPLGVPMLAGPGAITTVLVLADHFQSFYGNLMILGSIFSVLMISYLLFWQAERILGLIGRTGLNFLTRIMGLVLIVVAVQYILSGIKNFFH